MRNLCIVRGCNTGTALLFLPAYLCWQEEYNFIHEMKKEEWQGLVFSFLGGGIAGFVIIHMIASVASGTYSVAFMKQQSIQAFIDNFYVIWKYGITSIFSGYDNISMLVACGIAGALGFIYNSIRQKIILAIFIIISVLVSASRRIVVVATLPYRFAHDPPEVLHQMFSINLYFLIVYIVSISLSLISIIYLFAKYQNHLRRLFS